MFGRLKDKFIHMEQINKYNILYNKKHTLEQLGEPLRNQIKLKNIYSESILKENAVLKKIILKKQIVNNAVYIQTKK